MADYEKQFQANHAACGEPFPELVDFFAQLASRPCRILDLGCGQGRDALEAGRQGHMVHGVDIAPSGIEQMLENAEREKLRVTGEVADLLEYTPSKEFDVVVLDRVVHQFREPSDQQKIVRMAQQATRTTGFLLVADTASNLPRIEAEFSHDAWSLVKKKGGFRFYQRTPSSA